MSTNSDHQGKIAVDERNSERTAEVDAWETAEPRAGLRMLKASWICSRGRVWRIKAWVDCICKPEIGHELTFALTGLTAS